MRYGFLAWCAAALVLSGCDELLSTTQAVSVLTATPTLSDAQGMDAGLAAAMPLEELDESVTLAFCGVAQRESATDDQPPTPVTGAQVTLAWGSESVTLCDQSDQEAEGTYGTTNIPTESCDGTDTLAYVDNAEYVTDISLGGDMFSITVTAPPRIDPGNVTFTPEFTTPSSAPLSSIPEHDGSALRVSWAMDPNAGERPGFAVLMRLNYNGGVNWEADPNNPVFDNTPREPGAMIDLVLADPHADFIDIPATAFDHTGGAMYFLILTSMQLSTNTDGLQLGSGGLAGRGTAFAFWVD